MVRALVDDQGVKHEDIEKMREMVQHYFVKLFSSQTQEVDLAVLSDVNRRVTTDMNQFLMASFSREEVKKALFSIGDLKAPGPDGLHAVFFKRLWNMLGHDLVEEVLGAINNAAVPDGWNDTTIVLIPKIDNPEMVA